MLKQYRQRFILLNLILVGAVLLGTFVVIGTAIYRNDYAELKKTMSAVLKPWNTSQPSSQEKKSPPQKTGNAERESKKSDTAERKPQERSAASNRQQQDDNITTIFYDKSTDKISVLSETLSFDGDVQTIVHAIMAQQEDFGTLKDNRVIYYRQKTQNEYKIAVTDVSYIGSHMLNMIMILSGAYLLSMGLVLAISIRLSHLAAKPMEKAMDMERKFVADISHDLKTPITVILANNSIIRSNPALTVGDNMQWLDSTENAASDMMELISQMLTLSSLESVEQHIKKESVNLSSTAERCVLQLESIAYERNITIEDSIQEQVIIQSEEEYTRRICSSLIENALKYEPDNGKIDIKVYTSRKKAVFSVQNFGSVIDREDLPHIFDRFYRSDKTRNLHNGHGLGLPIIRQMTKLLDAHITVESSPANGTTFLVIFEL